MSDNRKVYIETFGCQMNLADTEIVLRILDDSGFSHVDTMQDADIILVNTCAVRFNAEQRVKGRLGDYYAYKKATPNAIIGVLGCMAERIRKELMESAEFIDFIAGPDEYRKLPSLIEDAKQGVKGIAVKLSCLETYDDIVPLRTDSVSAWISIMRGCDKFCSFCVVPFTRGRERSRLLSNIVNEVGNLSRSGFKEVTLLGQNVNSYTDGSSDFADLLMAVADVDKNMRIRFTTSHPQDMSDKLINVIASRNNICNYIHLPVQSGSDRILEMMNRNYTVNHYLNLVRKIKESIPDISLSTDIISGFPTESEDDHKQTLALLEEIEFDSAFTFRYSPRENTKAWRLIDDVPEPTKHRRLNEIIDVQRNISMHMNKSMIGRTVEVLIEGQSKKSNSDFCGRTNTNKMVIFPKNGDAIGDYISIDITRANSATLFGTHSNHKLKQAVTTMSQED